MKQAEYDSLIGQLNKAIDWFYENSNQDEADALHKDVIKILATIETLRVKTGDATLTPPSVEYYRDALGWIRKRSLE